MALIPCVECSGQVSDKATSCPHCGCPVKEATPIPLEIHGQSNQDTTKKRREADNVPKKSVDFDDDFDGSREFKKYCGLAVKYGLITMPQAVEGIKRKLEACDGRGLAHAGDVLVDMGLLTPDQNRLIKLVHEHKLDKIKVKINEADKGLCKAAVAAGFIKESCAVLCLKWQAHDIIEGHSQRLIGDYLIAAGYLSESQVTSLREGQLEGMNFGVSVEEADSPSNDSDTKIGTAIVREGLASNEDVKAALQEQAEDLKKGRAQRVGDYLVAANKVGREEMERLASAKRLKKHRLLAEAQRKQQFESTIKIGLIAAAAIIAIALLASNIGSSSARRAVAIAPKGKVTIKAPSPTLEDEPQVRETDPIDIQDADAPVQSELVSKDPSPEITKPATQNSEITQSSERPLEVRVVSYLNDARTAFFIPEILDGPEIIKFISIYTQAINAAEVELNSSLISARVPESKKAGLKELMEIHLKAYSNMLAIQRRSAEKFLSLGSVFDSMEIHEKVRQNTIEKWGLTEFILTPDYLSCLRHPLLAVSQAISVEFTISRTAETALPSNGAWLCFIFSGNDKLLAVKNFHVSDIGEVTVLLKNEDLIPCLKMGIVSVKKPISNPPMPEVEEKDFNQAEEPSDSQEPETFQVFKGPPKNRKEAIGMVQEYCLKNTARDRREEIMADLDGANHEWVSSAIKRAADEAKMRMMAMELASALGIAGLSKEARQLMIEEPSMAASEYLVVMGSEADMKFMYETWSKFPVKMATFDVVHQTFLSLPIQADIIKKLLRQASGGEKAAEAMNVVLFQLNEKAGNDGLEGMTKILSSKLERCEVPLAKRGVNLLLPKNIIGYNARRVIDVWELAPNGSIVIGGLPSWINEDHPSRNFNCEISVWCDGPMDGTSFSCNFDVGKCYAPSASKGEWVMKVGSGVELAVPVKQGINNIVMEFYPDPQGARKGRSCKILVNGENLFGDSNGICNGEFKNIAVSSGSQCRTYVMNAAFVERERVKK